MNNIRIVLLFMNSNISMRTIFRLYKIVDNIVIRNKASGINDFH